MTTLLECKGVSFGWGQDTLFSSFNLALSSGRIHGLLGRNGAGKTTLVKLLCGLVRPHAGSCVLHGDVARQPIDRAPELLQDLVLVPEAADLPDLPAAVFGDLAGAFYPRFMRARYLENLRAFEVRPDLRVTRMSFGQKRKTHIAFALATDARVLFLDEPTNGLDVAAQIVLRQLLVSHVDMHRALIVSTHHIREFEAVLDDVLILERGRIIKQGTLADIKAEPGFKDLEDAYARLVGIGAHAPDGRGFP